MRVALIAHDRKKVDLLDFTRHHREALVRCDLCATGSTGKLLSAETGLDIHPYLSGPLGGDQQIGSEIANGRVDMLIFFRDPLTPHPHEPDVSALLRLSDVRGIPVATNRATAEALMLLLASRTSAPG